MPFVFTGADDERLNDFRQLKRSKDDQDRAPMIAEGAKLVECLLDLRWTIDAAVVSDRFQDRFAPRFSPSTQVFILPHLDLDKLIGFKFHRGVLASAPRPARRTEVDLADGPGRRFVVCTQIRDPANLGAIARSAAAFGWDGIIVGPETPDPFSRRVLRTSMGAVLRIDVGYTADPRSLARNWAKRGVVSAEATLSPNAVPYRQWTPPNRVALWLGNEDAGLPSDISRQCEVQVTIPLEPIVDSLNVAVAAGVLLEHYRLSASTMNIAEGPN